MRILLPVAAAAMSVYRDDYAGLKELGYSVAVSQGATAVLKKTVHSERPDGTGEGFPSGHTSMAFASASYVHLRYGAQPAIPFYALAGLTAYSRVANRHHFAKDVVAGALLGSASAYLFTHRLGPQSVAAVVPAPHGVALHFASTW